MQEEALRARIIDYLVKQGFTLDPHLRPRNASKEMLKKIHRTKRLEVIRRHSERLISIEPLARKYSLSGAELNPAKISLELREVHPRSEMADVYFWWRFAWWSLPYEHCIGRHMRFILWDKGHNAPFGLLGLQSPTIRQPVRDGYLGLDRNNSTYWINQSLYAYTVGAIPPYSFLLGSKMVALSIVSDEIRQLYERKYRNCVTLLKQRSLPARLLFVTTTSAYGESPIYDRLKVSGIPVCQFLGFTQGSGTFHISEELYRQLLEYLKTKGANVDLGFGTGASRKLRLIDRALRQLGLGGTYHNIPRGMYLFSLVNNLKDVISGNNEPDWKDNSFEKLYEMWLNRWCLPRSNRQKTWLSFKPETVFRDFANDLSPDNGYNLDASRPLFEDKRDSEYLCCSPEVA